MTLTYRYAPPAKASPSPAAPPDASPEPSFGPAEQTTYRRGLAYHEIDRAEGVSTESGFDGTRLLVVEREPLHRHLVRRTRERRAITSNAVDAGAFDDTTVVQPRAPQTIDGTQYDVVRVTPHGGVPADLAIDRTTGAFAQVTYDPDDRYNRAVVRILGYTEIAPGVRVPVIVSLRSRHHVHAAARHGAGRHRRRAAAAGGADRACGRSGTAIRSTSTSSAARGPAKP